VLGLRKTSPSSRAQELGAEIDRVRATRRLPPRGGMRKFDAAVVDRLTASWLATGAAIDQELRGQLDLLRARSRDMFKNNPYAAKFGRMFRNNIVGAEGFTLQVRVVDVGDKPDTAANRAIEAAFWRWSRPENCDVTGRRSFPDMVRGAVTALARDGEFLFRKVRGTGRGEFSYQLQSLDVSRLDTTLNREAAAGQNAIVMGVELDPYRRPVAYHIWTAPAASGRLSRERERVPAAEIIHQFIPMEDEQTRGVPLMHAAMRMVNDLHGYREAAVIAARIGASKMGFYKQPEGAGGPDADDADDDGNLIRQASPGEFEVMPAGYEFQTFDPTYPHDQFDAFCKAALRGIASGVGVAYHTLANDLEGVNYSSIRAGVLDEREEWMAIQNWLTSALLTPVYEEWIETALLAGAIKLPNGAALPASKLFKFRQHAWQGRRWAWVDPLKDIQASALAIDRALASPQQIAAQSGRDVEDILDDIAAFQALVAAKGVVLGTAATAQQKLKNETEPVDE
jgi:lambda family phage portal protein